METFHLHFAYYLDILYCKVSGNSSANNELVAKTFQICKNFPVSIAETLTGFLWLCAWVCPVFGNVFVNVTSWFFNCVVLAIRKEILTIFCPDIANFSTFTATCLQPKTTLKTRKGWIDYKSLFIQEMLYSRAHHNLWSLWMSAQISFPVTLTRQVLSHLTFRRSKIKQQDYVVSQKNALIEQNHNQNWTEQTHVSVEVYHTGVENIYCLMKICLEKCLQWKI